MLAKGSFMTALHTCWNAVEDNTDPGQPELCLNHSRDEEEVHHFFWSSFLNPKRKKGIYRTNLVSGVWSSRFLQE